MKYDYKKYGAFSVGGLNIKYKKNENKKDHKGINFLHNHVQLENSLRDKKILDYSHVIVDRKDWEEARVYFGFKNKGD